MLRLPSEAVGRETAAHDPEGVGWSHDRVRYGDQRIPSRHVHI